jgi:hypothetical protein
MALPRELERRFREELEQFEEEQKMPFVTSAERLGREEGRQEGLRLGLLDGIELALRVKFGAASQEIVLEIRHLTDLAVIRAVYAQIEPSRTIEDVRGVYR